MQCTYGPIAVQQPEGFTPYQQWPEYDLVSDAPPLVGPRLVGVRPKGMYRRLWPIVVEEYFSDDEPVLTDSDPEGKSFNRMLVWRRIFRTTTPPGWYRPSKNSPRIEGFATLDVEDYHTRWSESARRYYKKWHREYLNKTYVIERITADEFTTTYKKSTLKKYVRDMYLGLIARKVAARAGLEFWGARHIESGETAAAMAVITSTSVGASYYLCGCILRAHADAPLMVGLLDNWHKIGREQNLQYLHFGLFWQKGDPTEWKGFSIFKSKFGLSYIAYPPTLMRLARGKLF